MPFTSITNALIKAKVWSLTRQLRYRDALRSIRSGKTNFLCLNFPHPIPESQFYPFYHYRKQLTDRFGLKVSVLDIDVCRDSLSGVFQNIETICFQTWFDISQSELDRLVARLRNLFPNASFIYFDWFAPTDMRLASMLDPHIVKYVKKNTFSDLNCHQDGHFGDTNLSSYYGQLYGIKYEWKQYDVSDRFLKKVLRGPSFVTAPYLADLLGNRSEANVYGNKPIDLHARLGATGKGWYTSMRKDAIDKVSAMNLDRVASEGAVGLRKYLSELGASKITFSPFGYGEVCWRDFEAIAMGSVLLKPDMAHMKSVPGVFIPNKTYMPIRWDMSDLEQKTRYLLENPEERLRLSQNAFRVANSYFQNSEFVDHVGEIIDS